MLPLIFRSPDPFHPRPVHRLIRPVGPVYGDPAELQGLVDQEWFTDEVGLRRYPRQRVGHRLEALRAAFADFDAEALEVAGEAALELATIDIAGKLQCTTAAGNEAIRFTDLAKLADGRAVNIARRRGG